MKLDGQIDDAVIAIWIVVVIAVVVGVIAYREWQKGRETPRRLWKKKSVWED